MFRPWQTAVAFTLCLAVVLAALAWVSMTVMRLDREQAAFQEQAALEENVRLALWRLDSAAAPILARENMRPFSDYTTMSTAPPAPQARNAAPNAARTGAGLESNLAAFYSLIPPVADVKLYCQIAPNGDVSSPQIASGKLAPVVGNGVRAGASSAESDAARTTAERLAWVREKCEPKDLLASVPLVTSNNWSGTIAAGVQALSDANEKFDANSNGVISNQPQPQAPQQAANGEQQQRESRAGTLLRSFDPQQAANVKEQLQTSKNTAEFAARAQRMNVDNYGNNRYVAALPEGSQALVGVMTPIWRSGELLLVRRVGVGGETYLQGCWLDWPVLRESLLVGIRDLLPRAVLEPAPSPEAHDGSRLMAALPVRLVPGDIDDGLPAETSPLLMSLIVAWGCVLLAVAAVAVLLLGVVTLSERRSAFVSAVTHELRTPLTTFRMYAEMLADGMVTDAEGRRRYLETLRIEAGRLTHLVENVLAYARLERGTARGQPEVVKVADLIQRMVGRLEDRAALADMKLVVETDEAASSARVRADLARSNRSCSTSSTTPASTPPRPATAACTCRSSPATARCCCACGTTGRAWPSRLAVGCFGRSPNRRSRRPIPRPAWAWAWLSRAGWPARWAASCG